MCIRDRPTRGAYFGEGSGQIHLSQAQCEVDNLAQNAMLVDCAIDKDGINECLHSQDAGAICSG